MLRQSDRLSVLLKIQLHSASKAFASGLTVPKDVNIIPSECPHSAPENNEFHNARPLREIPGPKILPFLGVMHHFLPGGQFHNKSMVEVHNSLRKQHGDLVFLPGSLGRPDLVVTYDPDQFAKLYRNEGQYPHRRAFAVFEYFRKYERPDLFKGRAGLLTE